jgi:hypothetical protein
VTSVFTYQPVQLAMGTPDREGLLVFWGADLLAVLVRLSPETHDGQGGLWFLEAGFGACADRRPPLFTSPAAAEPWFTEQISKARCRTSPQTEGLRLLEHTRTRPHKTFH